MLERRLDNVVGRLMWSQFEIPITFVYLPGTEFEYNECTNYFKNINKYAKAVLKEIAF